ncbi:hypothetical protein HPB47_021432 [Ixodes persulcatus]|uniref:Uncharacterized protein n=1 Tax=Ixodes persulcatus TaxID=34615 RepID=A0AC60QF19_IXOPE|nr:hypothetical protein HPB47_021432 [Ixodes persulcatus]
MAGRPKRPTLEPVSSSALNVNDPMGTQSLGIKAKEKKQAPQPPRSIDKKDAGARPPLRCFLCDRVRHRAADCRERALTRASCWRCGRTGHSANACQQGAKGRPQASCCVAAEQTQKEESIVQNGNLMGGVPVRAGRVGKRAVTVLRDTGCNRVIVRRSLIPKEDLTGTAQAVYLVTALCMESPLYDIILGNIPGARAAGEPNPEWEVDVSAEEPGEDAERTGEPSLSAAVQTRLQKMTVDQQATGPTRLRVPDVGEAVFMPEVLKKAANETCAAGTLEQDERGREFPLRRLEGKETPRDVVFGAKLPGTTKGDFGGNRRWVVVVVGVPLFGEKLETPGSGRGSAGNRFPFPTSGFFRKSERRAEAVVRLRELFLPTGTCVLALRCVFWPVGLVVALRCEFVRGAVFVRIISPLDRPVFIVQEPKSTVGSVWTWTPLR